MTVATRAIAAFLAASFLFQCFAACAAVTDISASIGDWIREDNPTANSSNEDMFVGSLDGANALRGLLSFDLSTFLSGDIVNNATISVHHQEEGIANHKPGSATDTSVLIHLATQDFTNDSTWNTYDGTNSWSSAGGDFGAALATTSANVETIDLGEEVAFNSVSLTAAIQSAITNGDPEISFVLTAPDLEATGVRDFFAFSGDSAPGANEIRPNLNIDFSPQFDQADVNRDGTVDSLDFQQISNTLFEESSNLAGVLVNSDIDGSGLVDFADFRIWKETPLGAAFMATLSIPEPGTLTLLATVLLIPALSRSRWK